MHLLFPQGYIKYQNSMLWFDCVKKNNKKQLISNFEKIYVFEHDDVYTAGKSVQNNLLENNMNEIKDIPVFYTDRGGLWTWHGKGQVVVYFIYNIYARKLMLSDFMNVIENIVVENITLEIEKISGQTLRQLGVFVYSDDKKRGFWIKQKDTGSIYKIGFIGLRVSNGFVYHGISINYNNNLDFFNYINPCGLGNVKITSIKEVIINTCKTHNALDINIFKHQLGWDLFNELNILHG